MATRLIFLAHAATPAHHLAAFPADELLDDKGLAATSAFAPELRRFRHVLAGPKRRLAQTAEALGMTAATEPALDEIDYGRWGGLELAGLAAAEPDALALWRNDPAAAPHGGESIASLVRRVELWLDAQHDAPPTLALTHGSILRAAALAVLQAPLASFWNIDAPPLSQIVLTSDRRRWSLRIRPLEHDSATALSPD